MHLLVTIIIKIQLFKYNSTSIIPFLAYRQYSDEGLCCCRHALIAKKTLHGFYFFSVDGDGIVCELTLGLSAAGKAEKKLNWPRVKWPGGSGVGVGAHMFDWS